MLSSFLGHRPLLAARSRAGDDSHYGRNFLDAEFDTLSSFAQVHWLNFGRCHLQVAISYLYPRLACRCRVDRNLCSFFDGLALTDCLGIRLLKYFQVEPLKSCCDSGWRQGGTAIASASTPSHPECQDRRTPLRGTGSANASTPTMRDCACRCGSITSRDRRYIE